MRHHQRSGTWTAIVALIVWVALMPVSAMACQGPIEPGMYMVWYKTDLSADTRGVPADLEVLARFNTLELRNLGATPAFVLGRGSGGMQPEVPIQLPSGFTATHKLVSNTAAIWLDGRWVEDYAPNFRLDSPAFVPPIAVDNPVNSMRPAQIIPPAPQASRLVLLYGETLVTVPVSLTYALNPAYDVIKDHQVINVPCGMGAGYYAGFLQLAMLVSSVFLSGAGIYILVVLSGVCMDYYARRGSR